MFHDYHSLYTFSELFCHFLSKLYLHLMTTLTESTDRCSDTKIYSYNPCQDCIDFCSVSKRVLCGSQHGTRPTNPFLLSLHVFHECKSPIHFLRIILSFSIKAVSTPNDNIRVLSKLGWGADRCSDSNSCTFPYCNIWLHILHGNGGSR